MIQEQADKYAENVRSQIKLTRDRVQEEIARAWMVGYNAALTASEEARRHFAGVS